MGLSFFHRSDLAELIMRYLSTGLSSFFPTCLICTNILFFLLCLWLEKNFQFLQKRKNFQIEVFLDSNKCSSDRWYLIFNSLRFVTLCPPCIIIIIIWWSVFCSCFDWRLERIFRMVVLINMVMVILINVESQLCVVDARVWYSTGNILLLKKIGVCKVVEECGWKFCCGPTYMTCFSSIHWLSTSEDGLLKYGALNSTLLNAWLMIYSKWAFTFQFLNFDPFGCFCDFPLTFSFK